MSAITHDIAIKANLSTVYKALTTAEGLRAWFTAQVEGSGQPGTDWKLRFTDQPSFDWQILSIEDKRHVAWKCLQGPGDSPGTEAEFSLKSEGNNQCILTISHRGWTKDDPKFELCVGIWRTLMDHLQRYCETGIAAPVYL
jgi:uncharacterized protein YndB with AHSA1/START domain